MKRISCIAFIGLLSPVFASGPGEAAIDFLSKVKAGEVDLKPGGDTALRAHTSADKIQVIRKRLESLAAEIEDGELELGEVREDGEFAAVMVRQMGVFDDAHLQIFPVAMVQAEKGWIAAPVLASFENSVAGYTVPLKERLSSLEDWMMRERVIDLQELALKSAERTRQRIKNSIIGEDLEGSDLVKITQAFLTACGERNQAALLGFLGGLSVPLPDDWSERVLASREAVSKEAESETTWRLLVSPDVIRIPVHEEKDAERGMVSLAFLDPKRAGSGGTMEKVLLLHFNFEKDPQGRWRIDLPGSLMHNDWTELLDNQGLDMDLLDLFAKRLRENEPLLTEATAEEAVDGVIADLKGDSLRRLIGKVDLSDDPKEARVSAAAAAAKWWSLNEPGIFRSPVKLGFHQEGDLAVAAFQWFSAGQADRFELETLFFRKVEDGWAWTPRMVSEQERASQKVLSDWLDEQEADWRANWRDTLLESSLKLGSLPLDRRVSEDEARNLIGGWLEALKDRDIRKALRFTAWLDKGNEVPLKVLRNLSYELANAQHAETTISEVYMSDTWFAVGIENRKKDQTAHSFVPVLMTEKGPRLVPEIDLIAGEGRTRDFLNGSSFDRLGAFVEKSALEDIRKLFVKFQKDCEKELGSD